MSLGPTALSDFFPEDLVARAFIKSSHDERPQNIT